jgi:hypothetical protein
VIFGALQVTKVLSTEEAKRAIEGSGKDFGKSTPEPANPSGLPTDPSKMAVTMEMSVSANQIAGFNPRIRQLSCVRPLFVTD